MVSGTDDGMNTHVNLNHRPPLTYHDQHPPVELGGEVVRGHVVGAEGHRAAVEEQRPGQHREQLHREVRHPAQVLHRCRSSHTHPAVLTEIYPCAVCACLEILRRDGKHKRGANEVPDIGGGRSVPYDALMMRRG
jgi:hypothetical protein